MRRKISSIRRRTIVIGCRPPSRGARPGRVTSTALARSRAEASRRASSSPSRPTAASISAFAAFARRPNSPRSADGRSRSLPKSSATSPSRPRNLPFSLSNSERDGASVPAASRKRRRTASMGSWLTAAGPPADPAASRRAERLLGHPDEVREGRRIGHGDLRQHLPVELVAGLLQPVDEPAVRDLVLAGGGVDPHDPEPAEVPLLRLAIPIRVDERLLHLELRHPVRLRLGAVIALGERQGLCALVLSLRSALYARHG